MKTNSLRIAILHLGFFYSGGGEKLVLEEMRGLEALGHKVDCYAPFVDREGCFPDITEMAKIRPLLPAPPRWLPMKDPLWVTLSCLVIPLLAWRFRTYDVLVGANQPGPWFAYLLSKILKKPYVIYLAQPLRILHPREIDLENGIRIREGDHHFLMAIRAIAGWLINLADRISVRHADVVLTNGEHVARWIEAVYGIETIVCAAGCHPVQIRRLEYSGRWKGELKINELAIRKPYILLTNRHSPMKRFEYAIWAMKSLSRYADRVTLVITGQETEYTHQLRYLVDGLRLKGAVKFVGLVSEKELSLLYRNASAYVYPSPEEDFGMGIVEAMASGTPVVAWNNGGPTVTVKNRETGFLVEPYDTDSFAEKLLLLSTQPEIAEKMGRAGHQRATELFSYEQHNQIIERAAEWAVSARRTPEAASEIPPHQSKWVED